MKHLVYKDLSHKLVILFAQQQYGAVWLKLML